MALYLCLATKSGKPIRVLPEGLDFQEGDVLLLGSSTFRGKLLKAIDGGTLWAHVGLVELAGGAVSLIHADPERGVVRQGMQDYLAANDVDALLLLRPTGGDGVVAADYARGLVERRTKFKDSFRYKQGEGCYCTELVLLAWESAGVAILPEAKSGDRIRPSELTDSGVLRAVWNITGE